jgi:HEPN domain-containing protein
MQPDRRTTAEHWFTSAENDLTVARDYAERIPTIACFHAREAAEKALKGLLVIACGDAPRTHLASTLVDELLRNDAALPAEAAMLAKSLDKFYAPTRYPDALGGGDPNSAFIGSDARSALQAA